MSRPTMNGEEQRVAEIRCDAYNDDPLRVKRVAEAMLERPTLERAAQLHEALSHPVRMAIMYALCIEPLCVCELAKLLRTSSPALMFHLRKLASAGAIKVRKEGKFAVYHPANGHAVSLMRAGLEAA